MKDNIFESVLKTGHDMCQDALVQVQKVEMSKETTQNLTSALEGIVDNFNQSLSIAVESEELLKAMDEVRVKVFGKSSALAELLKSIGTFDKEDRKEVGKAINIVKTALTSAFDEVNSKVRHHQDQLDIKNETIDVSLDFNKKPNGSIHPLNQVFYQLCGIFVGMGFEIKEGPEVELDLFNFDKLNLPKGHPARDMQDTFYISDDVVLRTHTSPVQVRTMINEKPPIKILSPGRVYRSDDIDATHSPIFHQMEGLVIDKGITLAHLKGVLDTFASEFFGPEIKVRLRPSYFPFTEPSAEVDLTCVACKGEGCRVCKHTGWIEVLGCGMVNPVVLENCGIDSEVYSGFAFGLGIDRIANLKYENNDIRLLYENDVRFLRQF